MSVGVKKKIEDSDSDGNLFNEDETTYEATTTAATSDNSSG